MADYYVPRAQINQLFSQTAVSTEKPLAALIIGPQYKLFRYNVATEKTQAVVETAEGSSNYDGSAADYLYQNKAATSTIDLDYVKVYLDNAKLAYYSPGTAVTMTAVANEPAQLSCATLVFKTGYTGTRTAAILRDVRAGDLALISATVDGTSPKAYTVKRVVAPIGSPTVPASATNNTASSQPAAPAGASIAVSGTYAGTKEITYRIICTKGGASTVAELKVVSDELDYSAPVAVTTAQAYDLGTLGLKFTPTIGASPLLTGNEWIVTAKPGVATSYNILEFEEAVDTQAGYYLTGIQVIKNGINIPQINTGSIVNWTATQEKISLVADLLAIDPEIPSADIIIAAGTVIVERRDLVQDNVNYIGNVSSPGSIEAKLGTIHPDNTLSKGVYNAVLNSGNTVVYFAGVASNDIAGYSRALEIAKKDTKYYNLVPLTFDETIIQLVQNHVEAQSDPKQAKWRCGYISRKVEDTAMLYDTKADGTSWTAWVAQTPGSNPATYSYINFGTEVTGTLTADAEATLVTDQIRAGDKLLYGFEIGAANTVLYQEATVIRVVSQSALIVDHDFTAAQAPQKVQIRRDYTSAEKAANYKLIVNGYNNRRITPVFPDYYKSGTVTEQGYLLAASLAGLASSVVPHQSLTNFEVLGPTDLTRVLSDFTEDDLDDLASEGLLIITQSTIGSPAYVRHELTSDSSGLNTSASSVTRNVDSISYGLQKALAPFIGKYNINAGSILKVRAAIDKELIYRMTKTATEMAGPQLLGYNIKSIAQDVTFKDKLNAEIELQVPAPMNYITVNFIV